MARGPFLHRHQGNSALKQHYYCHYYKILFEVWKIIIAVQKLWSAPVVNGKTSAKQNKIKTLHAETETNIYEQTRLSDYTDFLEGRQFDQLRENSRTRRKSFD